MSPEKLYNIAADNRLPHPVADISVPGAAEPQFRILTDPQGQYLAVSAGPDRIGDYTHHPIGLKFDGKKNRWAWQAITDGYTWLFGEDLAPVLKFRDEAPSWDLVVSAYPFPGPARPILVLTPSGETPECLRLLSWSQRNPALFLDLPDRDTATLIPPALPKSTRYRGGTGPESKEEIRQNAFAAGQLVAALRINYKWQKSSARETPVTEVTPLSVRVAASWGRLTELFPVMNADNPTRALSDNLGYGYTGKVPDKPIRYGILRLPKTDGSFLEAEITVQKQGTQGVLTLSAKDGAVLRLIMKNLTEVARSKFTPRRSITPSR